MECKLPPQEHPKHITQEEEAPLLLPSLESTGSGLLPTAGAVWSTGLESTVGY